MSNITTLDLKLPQKTKYENILLKKGILYYSFEDRTVALSKRIINAVNKELSNYFNHLIYDFDDLVNGWKWDDYSIDGINNFMGIIPVEIQQIIIDKFNALEKNPLLDNKNIQLWVLAPANNFAEISIKEKRYLIPLAQWE